MNMNEMVNILKKTNYLLDNIETKGRQNLDILLAAMQNVDRVIAELNKGMKELESPQKDISIEIIPDEEGPKK